MPRNVFTVAAHIIDANGTFNYLDGYPKKFDSNSYQGDVDKAKKRAVGDASELWGAMCKRDDRKLQTVFVYDMYGVMAYNPQVDIAKEEPEEPEEETEPEAE